MKDKIETLEDWPDCMVVGCKNKCCLRLESPYCFPHTGEFVVKEAKEVIVEKLQLEPAK